ncbi:hypothetical protein EV210_10559 [Anaerospora hongkongensis]|uniref:Uncharacterized protein n=1 Tax=Anaerospora hongkongensis TaxID=244830 RepID=A0A4R1Q1W4_9FIRM|nr:hypothetical protein [Anaerospora hongkongensis]TCL37628.1 hypothetical protein EV210_10559 [Anaerospora hongkongensis]
MDVLVMENKWLLLLLLEGIAWSATIFMLYARYKLKSQCWFRAASVLLVMTGVIPQVLLGVVNFAITKELDLFTLVILLLILYGVTIGKGHVRQLDSWAQQKFSGDPRKLRE